MRTRIRALWMLWLVAVGDAVANAIVARNPYASRGCFGQHRVCNSQDDGSLTLTPISCTPKPPLDSYTEVRIHAGNWDSSLAISWIYQIVLSEHFQVPVAVVGNASSPAGTSFYHPQASLVYADEAYDWDGLERCHEEDDDNDADQQCVHLLPEVWSHQNAQYQQALQNGSIERDPLGSSTGIWGQTNWYLPQHTVKAYPALAHYLGLQQASPQHLEDIFQKPWTWEEYCQKISATRCNEPDSVALRPPATTQEAMSFFVEHLYTGYFRGNGNNNGHNINNTTAANDPAGIRIGGHIIAPSCHEGNIPTAMMQAQLDCNNISSLTSHPSGGYQREARKQIWKAATATKSHVMMAWWTPDSFVEAFQEQLQAVTLFPATAACLQNRVSSTQACSLNDDTLEGPASEEGVCDGEGQELRKAISAILLKERASTNIVDQSPVYEVIRNLRIPESDLRSLLKEWGTLDERDHILGVAYRDAVCRFVTDHWDEWAEYVVPQGYPRIMLSTDYWTNQPYLMAAQVVGGLAAMAVLIMGILTVRYRTRLAFVQAQIHFVWQVLLGFWLVTMAAVVYGKEPSDSRCLLGQYFVTMGFTFVYVPMLVKIANINRIAAQAMNKFNDTRSASTTVVIRIAPIKLFMLEAAVTICVLMYLMVWTAYDPPSRTETRDLHEQGNGTTVVETSIQCSSASDGWEIAVLSWETLLLVCATLLAILSQPVVDKFKETNTLGLLVFCQDAFLLLRAILFLSEGSPSVVSASLSFVLSLNALVSCGIYFIPLFVRIAHGEEDPGQGTLARREMQQTANANPAVANGDDSVGSSSSSSSNMQQQRTLGMGSASSGDLSVLIQNRLRGVQSFRPEPLTAECIRNHELETN